MSSIGRRRGVVNGWEREEAEVVFKNGEPFSNTDRSARPQSLGERLVWLIDSDGSNPRQIVNDLKPQGKELPAWASLIRGALVAWRDDGCKADVDPRATLAETIRFVQIVGDSSSLTRPRPSTYNETRA